MNFRRWVVFTFLIHVLVVAVDKGGGLVLYLLTANQPDQHGKSGIVASLPFILMAIANLGLATSLVYFLRRGRYSAQQTFSTTITVALIWGGGLSLLALFATLYVAPWIDPRWTFDPWLVVPWCAVVPLLLVCSYGNSVQLAVERVRDYGVVHLVSSIAFLPAFFAVYFWLGGDVAEGDVPMAVAWGRLASTVLVTVLVLWMVRKVVKLRFGLHRAFLKDGLAYGWKANITSTLTYLNHRIDLVVLGALYVPTLAMASEVFGDVGPVRDTLEGWLGSVNPLPGVVREGMVFEPVLLDEIVFAQVGFYSMAVTWAELVWHFPEAMRDLFFSKVAGSTHDEARRLTPVLSRLGLAVSVVAGIAVLLLIDPAMSTITWMVGKGDPWHRTWSEPVGRALVLLTPGTVAFTVSKVLQADLAARNQLNVCVTAQVMVMVVMLGLDLLWIPQYGAAGAALASTVAYVVSTLYTLYAYSRSTGTPSWTCLIVHWSDFRYMVDILNAVLVKLRWRRP
ncbi:MAG: polysaccharide biosynthesis C-terminal domain-containing protein [Planctomycetota bacterium]